MYEPFNGHFEITDVIADMNTIATGLKHRANRNDGLLATLNQCSMVPTYSHDTNFTNDDIIRSRGNEYHDGIPYSEYLTRQCLDWNEINTTGWTSGARTAYPSGTPEFFPGFSEVRVTRSLVLCVMFCRSLFVLLSFFLLAIVLSVLLQITDLDYLFEIFKLFLDVRP